MGTASVTHKDISDIHIHVGPIDLDPGKTVKDVTGVGKDQIEKIVKDLLPDEIRNLPSEVMHAAVNKVVIPVITDVVKPLEKLMFQTGVKILETTHREVAKLVGDAHQAVPKDLVDKAIGYAQNQSAGGMNDWARWLNAIGHPNYQGAWPALTVEEAEEQANTWAGWIPFANELKAGHRYSANNPQKLIDDFNAISFYIANAGNVSIGLYFTNMWDRSQTVIDTLKKYQHTGVPVKRGAIMDFVKALGPDKLDVTVSVKIEIGIEIGGSIGAWSVPADLFEVLLDEVLKEAGVPQ